MKIIKEVFCNECRMQYEIQWNEELYQEPELCAACGSDNVETMKREVLV